VGESKDNVARGPEQMAGGNTVWKYRFKVREYGGGMVTVIENMV